MELVVKLYNDKSSKIGIKFIYEYKAVREYESLLQKYPKDTFSVQIEFVKDKISMTLCSDLTGGKFTYKELEFKIDQLKRLQSFYKPGAPLQFVHVFPKENQLFIARPFRTREFFNVSDMEIIMGVNADY